MTIGLYNVNYHSYTDYSETLANPADITDQADYYTTNEESISGTGIDVKLGVILRPFEDSPFRVGVAIHTPTFYDLTSSQRLYMNTPFESTDNQGNVIASYSDRAINPGDNDYKIRTPWKFNISMATTVGNILALDAEYEYRDFGSTSVRYPDYGYNDRWNEGISGWHNSFRDPDLDNEASRYLKSMSTLRLGAELRMSSNAYLARGLRTTRRRPSRKTPTSTCLPTVRRTTTPTTPTMSTWGISIVSPPVWACAAPTSMPT